ncbi:MAG: iron ABC transporter permease [Propionibacteriaceae bacterium]|jgi:iron complex transport system permease protein|nr:iron ABC transporter permease [Propionibacteriaceae bacterium]
MARARERRGERGLVRWAGQLVFPVLALGVMVVAIAWGSVSVPLGQTFETLWRALTGQTQPDRMVASIIVSTRLPRVLCAALIGAGLSIGGAAMQGLLKNPLADGSTLGVSGGAALGAVVAIAFGLTVPGLPFGSIMVMAMLFAFVSLVIIMGLAYRLDNSLSTNTIILLGVIFSMFVSSIVSLLITFANDKIHSITFWLMGSLSGANYTHVLALAVVLLIGGTAIGACANELNAFAVGEDNARHVGIDVRRVKVVVLVAVSALIGVCVSVGGTIAFVGLVTPHMVRLLVGPNHRRLLPASLFGGAAFLMLADLVARVALSPRELPIGVVTSFIGAIFFLAIFSRARRGA